MADVAGYYLVLKTVFKIRFGSSLLYNLQINLLVYKYENWNFSEIVYRNNMSDICHIFSGDAV